MNSVKHNYQQDTDAVLTGLDSPEKPSLLLHSCCGPCSTYVLEYLIPYFELTVLFYGPNIQPREEYEKRLFFQREVLKRFPAHILECSYDGPAFDAAVRGLEHEPEGGARCPVCFRLRLEEAARLARDGGFAFFGTTLTVSPHKNAPMLNAIGEALGAKYGVRWLPSDFKKRDGYLRSIRLSKQYGIYRQEYCGCGLPEEEKP